MDVPVVSRVPSCTPNAAIEELKVLLSCTTSTAGENNRKLLQPVPTPLLIPRPHFHMRSSPALLQLFFIRPFLPRMIIAPLDCYCSAAGT